MFLYLLVAFLRFIEVCFIMMFLAFIFQFWLFHLGFLSSLVLRLGLLMVLGCYCIFVCLFSWGG
jgi:hypothetical protein